MIDLVSSGILLGLFVIMVVGYAAKSYVAGRVAQDRDGKLLGRRFVEAGYWLVGPAVNLLHALGATPNMVTLGSLVPAAGAAVAFATGHLGLGALLGVMAALCDLLDGILARRLGISSDAGEVVDAATDRYTEYLVLAGLVVHYRDHLPFLILILAAIHGSFMISYSTAKAESLGLPVPKGMMRRAERTVFTLAGATLVPFLALALPPAWAARPEVRDLPLLLPLTMVAVLANISAVGRFAVITRQARERAAAAKGQPATSFTEPPAPASAARAGAAR